MKLSTLVATLLAASPLITTAQPRTTRKQIKASLVISSRGRTQTTIPGMLSDLAEDAKNFGRSVGRDGFRRVLEDIFTTFPDWHVEIVEMVTEGDSVRYAVQSKRHPPRHRKDSRERGHACGRSADGKTLRNGSYSVVKVPGRKNRGPLRDS